jgi:type I restriction enzyme S subunit
MPKINQKVLNAVPVPLPDEGERAAITAQLDEAFALARRVDRQIASATRQVGHSPQTILAKAFRGDLLPAAQVPVDR